MASFLLVVLTFALAVPAFAQVDNNIEKALTAMFTEMERVARFGFTATELERVRTNYLRSLEPPVNWEREYSPGFDALDYLIQKAHARGIDEKTIMLTVLGLIDVVMIANLLIMVIIGGYETFVSRMRLESHPDQPEWLSHVNASVLKVKLATAIIGISSIHLLKTFINAQAYDEKTLLWQTLIHVAFLFSALAGQFGEKFNKDALIRAIKIGENMRASMTMMIVLARTTRPGSVPVSRRCMFPRISSSLLMTWPPPVIGTREMLRSPASSVCVSVKSKDGRFRGEYECVVACETTDVQENVQ